MEATIKHLLECVPNFSEGRRRDVVDAIVDAASRVEGVHVLDVHSDQDHNRSVLTMAGEQRAVADAAYRATERATELIDLREHRGEHPRLGATDVVPFIPLGDTPMGEAVQVAQEVGERIARELGIPVYLYEEAATTPERRNLEFIRRKGFEELRTSIGVDPERRPDFGSAETHASAGAVVVGARGPLIAYNIYLSTTNLAIAKAIAKAIRHSSGGLRYVKALGLDIPARGEVQVSMNLTNYRKSAIQTVFAMVESVAASYGVAITESEVVGLVPMEALLSAARHYLRLHNFDDDQILEVKLIGT